MSANASIRAQRQAVLESPLAHFEAWFLKIDCGDPDCRRDRAYALADLAGFYGRTVTVGEVLRRLRCQECAAPVKIASLQGSWGKQVRARSVQLLPA